MPKITDITLCNLNLENASVSLVSELYELLLETGIDYIEINVPVLNLMGGNVDAGKTVLRLDDPKDIDRYPSFSGYICRYRGYDIPKKIISEFQINDIREINFRDKYSGYDNVRVTGLDDLILFDYLNMFSRINAAFPGKIQFCPQDQYGCATAMAVEWVLAGGENIAASFLGTGGYAAVEEVIMALRITKRHKPNQNLSAFARIRRIYEEISGETVPPYKAVVGEHIFYVESGIHVDGIIKNTTTFEPFDPKTVGGKRKIVIGKHSGKSTIIMKLKKHNIEFSKSMIPLLLETVKNRCEELDRSITDNEFIAIAEELKGDV